MTYFRKISSALLVVLALWLTLCASGCSSAEYRYVPAQHPASVHNKSLALYSDPLGPHSGLVRISSMGIVTLRPKNDSKDFPALHLRMAISNQTQTAWTLNAQDQSVSFSNQGATKPVFINSDTDGLPHLEIQPGELRTLDLYFPLPGSVSGASDLPEFDFHWTFRSGAARVAEMTPFERQPVLGHPPVVYPYSGPYLSLGWGPRWWYGPRPYGW